jgi:hypothetical protein
MQAGSYYHSVTNPDFPRLYQLGSTEDYVYHYTKAKTLVQILQSRKLRATSFAKTNDPREYKNWVFNLSSSSGFYGLPSHSELETRASTIGKQSVRLICTTTDRPEAVGPPGLDVIYGRGFCRSRMWAQYAEQHTGACIVMHKVQLQAAIMDATRAPIVSSAVSYLNRGQCSNAPAFTLNCDDVRTYGLEKAVAAHIAKHVREIYFEKSLDWADEREYRWLIFTSVDADLYVPMKGALAAVVLGDQFPDQHRSAVHDLLVNSDVPIGRMNWKFGIPEMQPSFVPVGAKARSGWFS